MEKKYNFALLPTSKTADFIRCAQPFKTLADQYLLGENALPHVTLYQFQAEEAEINGIWQYAMKAWHDKPIVLTFNEFSFKYFNDIYWISLIPDKRDVLHNMHKMIADVIKQSVKKDYDPHLTLLNTQKKASEVTVVELAKSYALIADTFVLSLGKSGASGQYLESVYSL